MNINFTVSKNGITDMKIRTSDGKDAVEIGRKVVSDLSDIVKELHDSADDIKYDIAQIKERDPAAVSNTEVALLYSGFHAVMCYRVAHAFQKRGYVLAARTISQAAKFATGIEIHPGATIGKGLFIDHGMGVVIGETTEIGDDCTIYQGATLGGTGKQTGKRHPTLGNNVMVGAGAKVLGPFNVGDNSKIAAGAVVLREVPDNSTAVGIPARMIIKNVEDPNECDLDQIHIPDPMTREICALRREIAVLKNMINEKEAKNENI